MCHELVCDLFRKDRVDTARNEIRGQFPTFARIVGFEFCTFSLKSASGLGCDFTETVLSSGHGHCPCDQSGRAGDKNTAVRRMCGGDAQ